MALRLLEACLPEQIELGHLSFVGQELAAQPDLLRAYVSHEEREWLRHVVVSCVAAAPQGRAVLESSDLTDDLREDLAQSTARDERDLLLSLPTPLPRTGPFERAGGTTRPGAATSPARAPLQLTPREMQVLDLMAGGLRNDEIAARLVLSRHTVKTHVNHIFAKLGVTDRVKAVLMYRESQDP